MTQIVESQDVEEVVLGSVLLAPRVITELGLFPEQFYFKKNQILYKTYLEMSDKGMPLELVSIADYIGFDQLDTVGGLSYLTQLAGAAPSAANIQHYATRVSEYWQKREAARIGLEIANGLDINEGMRKLQGIKERIANKSNGDIGEPLKKLVENMSKARGGLTGITTGYWDLNKITNGWQNTDLILLAARPGVGKTAFANNMILAAMKTALNEDGGRVLMFSAEMSAEQLLGRMSSTIGNIDGNAMRNGTMDVAQWRKFNHAVDLLWKAKETDTFRIIDTPSIYLSEIYRNAREMRAQDPDGKFLIVIDYLQLLKADGKWPSRREELDEISRSLKALAREMNCPVIALSQLTRGPEGRQDKRPMMSDLRDTGSLEQDADIVTFLYRDDYYDKESENQNLIEVIIAKHRNGPTGTVNLAFIKELSKFVNIDNAYPNR